MHTKCSNVANHAWSKNHQIDFENVSIIDKGNYRHLNTLESWHTAKSVDVDNRDLKIEVTCSDIFFGFLQVFPSLKLLFKKNEQQCFITF